jgi:hypothetical protein
VASIRVLLVSGNLSNGDQAGLAYLNFNNDSSNRNSNNGAQSDAYAKYFDAHPCLLAKHKASLQYGLVAYAKIRENISSK